MSPIGTITPPAAIARIGSGSTGISYFLSVLLTIFYSVVVVIFIFMLLFGAFQWITSGGDKDKVSAARARITNAVIGLAILGLAFLIAKVLGDIFGFQVIT